MDLTREQLEIAAQAWLLSMRRQWAAHANLEVDTCPVPTWDKMAPNHKHTLMRAIRVAFAAVSPENLKKVRARTMGLEG